MPILSGQFHARMEQTFGCMEATTTMLVQNMVIIKQPNQNCLWVSPWSQLSKKLKVYWWRMVMMTRLQQLREVIVEGQPASRVKFLYTPLKERIFGFGLVLGSTVMSTSFLPNFAPEYLNTISSSPSASSNSIIYSHPLLHEKSSSYMPASYHSLNYPSSYITFFSSTGSIISNYKPLQHNNIMHITNNISIIKYIYYIIHMFCELKLSHAGRLQLLMDNIEIKKPSNRRSVESLIEESAIDHSFNQEAHEMRRAFNVTIRELNMKIKNQERQIQKMEIMATQKDQLIEQQQNQIQILSEDIEKAKGEDSQIRQLNRQLKKRLQHVEYKLQTLEDNRKLVPMSDSDEEQSPTKQCNRKAIKNQTYKEIQEVLSKKIKDFTVQIKSYPMSPQLETNLQSFLQELLYLNPQTSLAVQNIFKLKNRQTGKIAERKNLTSQRLTDQQEWSRLEKSLEKLKQINRNRPSEDKQFTEKSGEKSRNLIRKQNLSPNPSSKGNRKIFLKYV